MYDFLLTATDENGTRTTQHVEATSAAEAYAMLESQGFQDITLHTDDAAAAAVTYVANQYVTPGDLVEMRFLSGLGFFRFLLKKLSVNSPLILLTAAALLLYKLYARQSLGVIGICAVILLVLQVMLAGWGAFFGPHRKYHLLIEAHAWGRWNEVLARAPTLRGKVPDFELDAREASALAGMGHLEKGLDRLRRYEDSDDPPRWMYLGRLSELYEVAEVYDEALKCCEQAYQADSENPTVELDYALALLKNNKDPLLARQHIHSAKEKPLSDLLAMFLPYVEGLLYLNTGKEQLAIEAFNVAHANFVRIAGGSPLIGQVIDLNKARLAIAQARLGNRTIAMNTAQPALKRLRAINAKQLFKQLEIELGLPAAPLAE
ncbi:MAG: hypothetical protein WD845_11525 [Pirellulales bacterium]